MSKRSISFNKPEDPSFLKRIKESIGYKEGPNVETKRAKLEDFNSEDEDFESSADYKPEVVVLKPGDLTAEEAEREKERLEREEKEKPADLSQRVLFKKPSKSKETTTDSTSNTDSKKSNVKESKNNTSKLSFADDDQEEEDN